MPFTMIVITEVVEYEWMCSVLCISIKLINSFISQGTIALPSLKHSLFMILDLEQRFCSWFSNVMLS